MALKKLGTGTPSCLIGNTVRIATISIGINVCIPVP